jgi:hypothetical protein
MGLDAALQILFAALVVVTAWIGFTGIARRGGFAKRVRLTGGWGTVYLFHDRENPHLLKVARASERDGVLS